ncbi:MAG: bifunctional diguanylate cyclase/phosphodiesterase [Lachnospiraceae bacterium]|nr:bifunctional diguanylate cyclase/phosphodiesterase [Lachnospiraceae bacterium]
MEKEKVIEGKLKLQQFFSKESEVSDLDSPRDGENICEVAQYLGIGKCEITMYETVEGEQHDEGDTIVFYDAGVSDGRVRSRREITGGGNVVFIRSFQTAGKEDWDEQEQELVDDFNKILFFCKSRAHMLTLLERAVFYDADTQLGNLKCGMRTIGMLIEQGRIGEFAAFFVNIRGMNNINTLVGMDNGTRVMKKYMKRISHSFQYPECVCRIGGDNFLIVALRERVQEIVQMLKGETVCYGKSPKDRVFVSATAGVYLIPEEVKNPYEVMNAISATLNIARYVERVPILFYDEKLIQKMQHNQRVETEFEKAIQEEEFHVYYQPKVSLHNYELRGAEALCRWIQNGMIVPPDSFIPVLEKSQKICRLDFYMLEHVCQDLQRWLSQHRQVVPVSVNFSRKHLGNPDLVEEILEVIDRYKIPHELIELELTETMTEADFLQLKQIVFDLRDAGIMTSVDDFGTGYSSLNLIREVPFKVLKIDKTFLHQEDSEFKRDNIMMKHVIGMASELDMECIAEGVETLENIKLLKDNKCYLAQGFLFDRPLPKVEFEKRLDGFRYCT